MKTIAIAALSALFAFAALTGAGVAAERSIDDCEKIQEADAYNQCLGRFGPPARNIGALTRANVGAAPDAGQDAQDAQDAAADEAPAKAAPHGRGRSRHAHGRRHGHGHAYAHRRGHAHAAQGRAGAKRMAFNTISNRHTR